MKAFQLLLMTFLSFLGFNAFAVGPDFSALTGAVDFSTVGTAILAIAALLAVPLVIRKGSILVLAAIR